MKVKLKKDKRLRIFGSYAGLPVAVFHALNRGEVVDLAPADARRLAAYVTEVKKKGAK